MIDWLVPPYLTLVRQKLKELVPSSDSNLTHALMYLFEMLLKEVCTEEKAAHQSKNLKI